jgi:hypothetical protein
MANIPRTALTAQTPSFYDAFLTAPLALSYHCKLQFQA